MTPTFVVINHEDGLGTHMPKAERTSSKMVQSNGSVAESTVAGERIDEST